jgi:hypothetical protein
MDIILDILFSIAGLYPMDALNFSEEGEGSPENHQ